MVALKQSISCGLQGPLWEGNRAKQGLSIGSRVSIHPNYQLTPAFFQCARMHTGGAAARSPSRPNAPPSLVVTGIDFPSPHLSSAS